MAPDRAEYAFKNHLKVTFTPRGKRNERHPAYITRITGEFATIQLIDDGRTAVVEIGDLGLAN